LYTPVGQWQQQSVTRKSALEILSHGRTVRNKRQNAAYL
jgi:hypothetical protein